MNNALFEEKYNLYSSLIYKLAMTYLGSVHDAEDITQEVFTKLFIRTKEFENDEHERYWVIRVTVNMCKNNLKTFWKRYILPIEEAADKTDSLHNDDTVKMLMSLKPKYRIVLYMFYYEGYSIKETADILSISESCVKMRLKRGKEKLKLNIEEENYGQEGVYSCNRQF
ncbi:MAG: sigma-70 family RNA polymerase sigma factor [Oscillospiraceae bacterium]|nr:sigma-70 family RNA polymerase sigma factor [Oscillospiraceae bacterium]